MASMDGSVALVTGGGNGIGRGAALELGRQGGQIVVADVDGAGASAVADQIVAEGGQAIAVEVDVSDVASVAAMTARGLEEYGRFDVVMHSPGIVIRQQILDVTVEDWQRVLDVNLTGAFHVSRAVAPTMIEQGSGTIMFVASDRGLYGAFGSAPYAASKGGLIAFMKSLALELAPHQVTVNAINPGTTDTERLRRSMPEELQRKRAADDPLGRFSTPEDIAQIVLFLATAGGKFMTGQLITTRVRSG